MACNCSAKYDNKVPCCCSQGSPLVCSTTTCADAQVCSQTVESDCVIYTGPNIQCSGVTSGMTVTEVMDIILEQLNLIDCSYCWNVTNNGTLDTTFDYVDADGNTVTYPDPVAAGATIKVCGRSIDTTNVSSVNIGRCTVCETPTTTSTTTVILSPVMCTITEGYYRVERTWSDCPYTFTLNSLVLDGVEYSTGQTLVIGSTADLTTGISPINGNIYITNISDWLNGIANVSTSGFVFYDDMRSIYKPDVNSTFSIEILMTNPGSPVTYYYTDTYGFAITNQDSTQGLYDCNPGELPIIPQARCSAINAAPGGAGGASSSGRGASSADNASYIMEKSYQDCTAGGYTFTLDSLNLNGAEYSNGETLTISYFEDLRIGLGVDGASPYIMNINDWLNTIPAVAGTGFVFYDEMSTIDLPDNSSTYDIQINSYNIATGQSINYRWFKLSNGTTGWNMFEGGPVPQTPYANIPWACSSPYVTTTTTINIVSSFFTVSNNTTGSQITYVDILVPDSGVTLNYPILHQNIASSMHNGIFADIVVSVSGGGRLRVFVDDLGDGNFIQRTCLTFSTAGNYTIDAGKMGPLSVNSSINIIYDNGTTC